MRPGGSDELYLLDDEWGYIHVFDTKANPIRPKFKGYIALFDKIDRPWMADNGFRWIAFSLDGKYCYPSSGEVVDCDAGKKTAMKIAPSEKLVEADEGSLLRDRHLEYFRALAEQSIAGIYMIDGGKITYMNPRAAQIFGYQPEEAVGRPVRDFVCEGDWPKLDENIRRRLAGEIANAQYEFKGRRKDGSVVMIGGHGTTATLKGRRIIIGVLQDVTDKLRAEETIRDYIARLERSILGTVNAVSSMVELRDPYTAGHERRVGELAAAIAIEMGLSEEETNGLRIIGLLHDIGKISLPAEILSKPSRLTPLEYEMVKLHPQLGYDILKAVDFPWPVAQTVLQHHERFDGSGYPQGLNGEEIVLQARIIAVADTVEAMASHRPYRPGYGVEAALKEIEEKAGAQRQPAMVRRSFRYWPEIYE